MTTPMPPQGPRATDQPLPGEAELAALYRQLPQDQPGPALDAAVRQAAAQALSSPAPAPTAALVERRQSPRESGDWAHPKPAATDYAFGRRDPVPHWLVGLGSTAALVLVAGLAWHLRTTRTDDLAASTSAAPLQAEAAPAAAPPPPAPPAPAKPAPALVMAAAPAPAQAKAGKEAVASTANTRQAAPVAGNVPTAGAALQAAAPAPVAETTADASRADDAPARELEQIRQLFAQGRDAEARQRLAAFRRAHPQWQLPPALRAQLREP